MPKLSDTEVPSYRLHKQSGQGIVTLNGRDILLGKHHSPESKEKYRQLTGQWLAAGRQLPAAIDSAKPITIVEIIAAYRRHAVTYYRNAAGEQTGETARIMRELAPLKELYGRLSAVDFGPVKLRTVREAMIKLGWCRTSINHAVSSIRRLFNWAIGAELIPSAVIRRGPDDELMPTAIMDGLESIEPLKFGRSDAPETAPVEEVADAHATAILPFVSRQVGAMIRLQLLNAMRPTEVCTMRGCNLNTSGKLWKYSSPQHKTAHHGHKREVYLGPQAQEIIREFLKLDPQAYLFDPREAETERRTAQHAARKTPMNEGTRPGENRKRSPRRRAGSCYTVASYRRSIARGCEQAFPAPAPLCQRDDESRREYLARLAKDEREALKQWREQHHFFPHMIRHTTGTRIRREFGLEAAQVILGQKTLTVTQVYAAANVAKAMQVMEAVG